MQFLEEEIVEITETTWGAMMGLDIQPNAAYSGPPEDTDILMGHVSISGAWDGEVRLQGTTALAQSAAAKIFAMTPESVQDQDQIDAMYELTNIIAGNIKSLLPEPCQLSLPVVQSETEWETHVDGADKVIELPFECEGQPLLVTVWQQRTA
jgi:chemotaxis protein CheX